MSNPNTPNYITGVGSLATNRADFESHVIGTGFRHKADQIDVVNPTLLIGTPSNVEQALENLTNTLITVGAFVASGDLTGTASRQRVIGLQGYPIADLAPNLNQVLEWNGLSWTPGDQTPEVFWGGDLAGSGNSYQVVTGIRGFSVPYPSGSSTMLTWNGSTFSWQNTFAAAGDLTGSSATQTVVGLQGIPLPTPTGTNTYLNWNGSIFSWGTVSGGGSFTAGGDLTGSSSAQTVIGIRGHSVPAPSGSNNFLNWNGSSLSWITVSGNTFTAGGDLSGTASSQTVIGLQGYPVSNNPPQTNNFLSWNGVHWATSPIDLQATGAIQSGAPLLTPNGGTGLTTTGTAGNVLVSTGTTSASWSQVNLSSTNAITSVLKIANGGTNQTSLGTDGNLLMSTGSFSMSWLANGTTGQVLTSTGASTAPTWQNATFTAGGDLYGTPTSQTIQSITGGGTSGTGIVDVIATAMNFTGSSPTISATGTSQSITISANGAVVLTPGTGLVDFSNETTITGSSIGSFQLNSFLGGYMAVIINGVTSYIPFYWPNP